MNIFEITIEEHLPNLDLYKVEIWNGANNIEAYMNLVQLNDSIEYVTNPEDLIK